MHGQHREMLSYRHSFHAGNHADMLKHFTLFLTLEYFGRKDKPYWYIDTHAGAGLYALDSGFAQKLGEYRDGWLRVRQAEKLPADLARFADFVRERQPENRYCGSPWLAAGLLRPDDRIRCFEMHPADFPLLEQTLASAGRRAQVRCEDGYGGLLSLLPPPPRRAVVLVDPPYEEKQDYRRVADTLQAALKRFATGCYLVWYPCLSRAESRTLPEKLAALSPKSLRAELHVRRPQADGFGMHGSGMFVINPPYVLAAQLRENLPALTRLLAQDDGAHFVLETQGLD